MKTYSLARSVRVPILTLRTERIAGSSWTLIWCEVFGDQLKVTSFGSAIVSAVASTTWPNSSSTRFPCVSVSGWPTTIGSSP